MPSKDLPELSPEMLLSATGLKEYQQAQPKSLPNPTPIASVRLGKATLARPERGSMDITFEALDDVDQPREFAGNHPTTTRFEYREPLVERGEVVSRRTANGRFEPVRSQPPKEPVVPRQSAKPQMEPSLGVLDRLLGKNPFD